LETKSNTFTFLLLWLHVTQAIEYYTERLDVNSTTAFAS